MSLVTRMRKQKCVYWPLGSAESGGSDEDSYGNPSHGSPIEIDCRWEDGNKEFVGSKGTTELSSARVFVDRDMQVGEMLMLGELDSSVDQDDPRNNQGAYEIRAFQKTPNLKATEFLRIAVL